MSAAAPSRSADDALPLAVELNPPPDVQAALLRFAARPYPIFFDSALRDPTLGRYSFLAADPFDFVRVAAGESDAFERLATRLRPHAAPTRADLPPFQGGAAGLFSYDLNRQLERLPEPRFDEFRLPNLAVGLYDVVLAWDHVADRAWLISQGSPESDPAARRRRAAERLAEFRALLAAPLGPRGATFRAERTPLADLAPSFPVAGHDRLLSNFAPEDYLAAVARAIEYIRAGDVFQVNLAQRLLQPADDDSLGLYLRLRGQNPATFAAYFDLGPEQIVSASPERFVQVRGRRVETRPIKGTRGRTRSPEADLFAADDLLASEKDRAENVMIVDLLRNDLSRVCRPESVHVTQLCRLETYAYVQHLVSVIEGTLPPDCEPLELLRAMFPGGSVTGAPKVRAMEIIAEIEPTARGPYCGALGYLGFDGALDASILIRTITAAGGWWQFPVGGGITAQSNPQLEYAETWHKAAGLLRALRPG